jgi:hypothetical protein
VCGVARRTTGRTGLGIIDGGELYAQMRAKGQFCGSQLNIEGAVAAGGALRLFQRGNGATIDGVTASNAIGDLDLARFTDWLDGTGPAPPVRTVRRVELGSIDGVPLGFTDATALPDGRIAFVACAEASPDTYRDGEVLGSKFGVLEEDGFALFDVLDEKGQPAYHKLEGIEFVGITRSNALEFAVVADMDDATQPAMLASLAWGPP